MKRWEYMIDTRIIGAEYNMKERQWLNALGDRGWELAGVFLRRVHITYYFKRLTEGPLE